MPSAVRRVGRFVGKECSEDEVAKLCDHMDIDNMRNNTSVQPNIGSSETHVFVRQGQAGGWRDHFNEAMRTSARNWMDRHLADTDISFPEN
ncbi:uncharacterized protein [Choristoneura fumiferana]|uniref:uncharacterized protein n=1 Tax=Choristoneura fumiferana TaxID=7141 RepID=UPI003D157391